MASPGASAMRSSATRCACAAALLALLAPSATCAKVSEEDMGYKLYLSATQSMREKKEAKNKARAAGRPLDVEEIKPGDAFYDFVRKAFFMNRSQPGSKFVIYDLDPDQVKTLQEAHNDLQQAVLGVVDSISMELLGAHPFYRTNLDPDMSVSAALVYQSDSRKSSAHHSDTKPAKRTKEQKKIDRQRKRKEKEEDYIAECLLQSELICDNPKLTSSFLEQYIGSQLQLSTERLYARATKVAKTFFNTEDIGKVEKIIRHVYPHGIAPYVTTSDFDGRSERRKAAQTPLQQSAVFSQQATSNAFGFGLYQSAVLSSHATQSAGLGHPVHPQAQKQEPLTSGLFNQPSIFTPPMNKSALLHDHIEDPRMQSYLKSLHYKTEAAESKQETNDSATDVSGASMSNQTSSLSSGHQTKSTTTKTWQSGSEQTQSTLGFSQNSSAAQKSGAQSSSAFLSQISSQSALLKNGLDASATSQAALGPQFMAAFGIGRGGAQLSQQATTSTQAKHIQTMENASAPNAIMFGNGNTQTNNIVLQPMNTVGQPSAPRGRQSGQRSSRFDIEDASGESEDELSFRTDQECESFGQQLASSEFADMDDKFKNAKDSNLLHKLRLGNKHNMTQRAIINEEEDDSEDDESDEFELLG